ncbi:polyphosphate polymerase domain-containing protein [Olsenella sp. Marseille-P4559]|uniref:polyphosphate polymerase domain-containing protein n=1 Tax=Olsenella sp. Marseille-P4559 TaxID=2364795 RepID=UPI0013EEECD8|nr:polyphosphate polymerase domain-containing protein [Olsenella sp. Marseille-P4559]
MITSQVAQPLPGQAPVHVQMVFKRTEAKYLLTNAQRSRLERLISAHVAPDEFGPSTVRNLYLDTPTLLLARRSLGHPLYKEKVRVRSYRAAGEHDKVFLELKKKCDGVVYKRRCTMELDDALGLCQCLREPWTQVELELAVTAAREGGLLPVAYVAYDREAFFSTEDRDLRLTFDRRVRARWSSLSLTEDVGEPVLSQGLNILEVKTSKAMPLWFVAFLSEERLRKATFSKYGTAYRLRYPKGYRPQLAPAPVMVPGGISLPATNPVGAIARA